MSIRKTLTLGWNGEEYSVCLTMRDIDKLERNGDIYELAASKMTGKPRVALTSIVLSQVFELAGGKVSEDEIFNELSSSKDAKKAVDEMINSIFDAIFVPEKKNEEPLK